MIYKNQESNSEAKLKDADEIKGARNNASKDNTEKDS